MRVVTWWRELQLPKWVLHLALGGMTFGGGYLVNEIRTANTARQQVLDVLVQQRVPEMLQRLAVHDIQISALNGSQERIERKVDLTLEKQDQLVRSVARIEAKVDRIAR